MLNIKLIKAFKDNYLFILTCDVTGEMAAVDPGDADAVINGLNGKKLDKILLTHHHQDHVGGVKKLCEIYNCGVFGYEEDQYRLPCVTTVIQEDDKVKVGASEAEVLYVPGHTMGHIAYYFSDDKKLFCGDTLFAGGCGRLFEGSYEEMFNSLVKLKGLPDETEVFCAHEYTVANYEFAHHVMPGDGLVMEALQVARQKRLMNIPTIPTTMGYEKKHNIFLRTESAVAFKILREAKDSF